MASGRNQAPGSPSGPRGGRPRGQRIALVVGVAALLVVAAGAFGLWLQRRGDPWARYRPVPLDPEKTYEVVLWETELPVAVLPDPLRLPEGPSPEPPYGPQGKASGQGEGDLGPRGAPQGPGSASGPGSPDAPDAGGPRDAPPVGPSAPGGRTPASQGAVQGPGRRGPNALTRRGQPPPVPPLEGPGPFTHREYLDQALRAFARQFPNVRVRVEWIPAREAAARLQRALADGKPPDVFGGWGSALLVRHPLQVPLNPYLGRAERRWYNPTALALYQADRRLWVWPRWVAPHTWWVRVGRVREAGLDPNALALTGWTYADVDRLAGLPGDEPGPGGAESQGAPSGTPQSPGARPGAGQADAPAGQGPGLTLWVGRADLPLEQLLRVRGVASPLAPSGAVLWAGPEGRAALAWLERLREHRLLEPVMEAAAAEWLAGDDPAVMAGGFTPALGRWLLERETGLVPRRLEEPPPPRPGTLPVPPLTRGGRAGGGGEGGSAADAADGDAAVPERWPLPPPPQVEPSGRVTGGLPSAGDPRRGEPLVPPDAEGLVLLPPPVPEGAPRPALLEVGGLMVFRQNRYRGDDHTQAAVELARFLSRWRTDVLTRRLLAVPADVTSLAAWRAESPLPAMYRRQLEHLVLGIWNRDARGRWQRLAVAYPVAPGAPGPEHEDVGRQVRPPLADFWAGEAGADGVIQRWGGSPAPEGGSPAPGDRSQAHP
ncbi:ABC transporter substrate-binding protein [Thermaerobacter composti]|uniref:Extracellular solute-binding protein n=1 Tax=Thermaerobacter composti TaxID=554949 RepID=A0ABZ0QNG3_9FIRM|nr:ABC transporter substrate-binding protein [Thermaerobacter composti]WPD18784.1 extracellular solute-binding protein [Thermaerobacter composti]